MSVDKLNRFMDSIRDTDLESLLKFRAILVERIKLVRNYGNEA